MVTGDQESTRPRRVLDSMPSAVFVMDELGTISLVSERASALVGKPAGEIEGWSVLESSIPTPHGRTPPAARGCTPATWSA
jgi:PAS domain-containing protein